MRGLALILAIALLLPFISCGYSQADLEQARDEGFQDGYFAGYILGRADADKAQPPTYIGPFIGSKNSDVYHYPWCIWADEILPPNIIWFDSPLEAQAAGYRPCKVCNPP
jgi:hypothetical protein